MQPLWELYESHFARNPSDSNGPARRDIAQARSLVDFDSVNFGPGLTAQAHQRLPLVIRRPKA